MTLTAGELAELPSYDPRDLWPDGYGWEPLEPWWDAGFHEWYRSLWRRTAPLPAKANRRPYGDRRRLSW